MTALVIYCHPIDDSFCSAMRDSAVNALRSAGHSVDVIDLAQENFNPVMSSTEWHSYRDRMPVEDEQVRRHIELLQKANVLVFVYPTWWSSMPAQLKGWLERVLVTDVAFTFTKHNKVRPALTHVQKIYVLSTFGSPRWYVRFIQDNGLRTFSRALRLCTGWAKVRSLALYSMDTQTQQNREEFLQRINRMLVKA